MPGRKRHNRRNPPLRASGPPPAAAAGQSGDLQGLPASPEADSQSVAELVEEGQSFEAGIVEGIENAPDPDQSEVKSSEAPEDDVPQEYTQKDRQ